jgi:two-component system CheB/CheR fusion protein
MPFNHRFKEAFLQSETLPTSPVIDHPADRILVVDDNRDAANSLAMLLRCLGYEVRAVYDGQAALLAEQEFEPRIVLLDLRLPGIDGFEVARRLRSRGRMECQLIAISGLDSDEHAEQVAAAGFACHLVKPVDPVRLEAVLAATVTC